MGESIEGKGIKIPAKFDIISTFVGLIGLAISLYLFWSRYLPLNESKTPYGIFIGVFMVASSSCLIFGGKAWKKRYDKEVKDEEKKRKLELTKKELENQILEQKIKKKK